MNISIGSYKVRVEILVAIVVVFCIIFGYLLCDCYKMNLFEGMNPLQRARERAQRAIATAGATGGATAGATAGATGGATAGATAEAARQEEAARQAAEAARQEAARQEAEAARQAAEEAQQEAARQEADLKAALEAEADAAEEAAQQELLQAAQQAAQQAAEEAALLEEQQALLQEANRAQQEANRAQQTTDRLQQEADRLQQEVDRASNFTVTEGFSGNNYTSMGPEFASVNAPKYIMNPSTWAMPTLTYSPGTKPGAGVQTFWDRPKQQIPPPEGQLDFFAKTEFKPECCPNTYSTSNGCACMDMGSYTFLKQRGFNNIPFSEY